MSYVLEAIQKPGYLHIRVTGENTPEVAAAYLRQMLAACIEHGCGVVLIEESLSGPPMDVMDVYQLASEIGEQARNVIRQVAYVDLNPDHSIGLMRFAGDVAAGHGVNVRIFSTVREAEQWLREGIQE